jgi:hypothetical protein
MQDTAAVPVLCRTDSCANVEFVLSAGLPRHVHNREAMSASLERLGALDDKVRVSSSATIRNSLAACPRLQPLSYR